VHHAAVDFSPDGEGSVSLYTSSGTALFYGRWLQVTDRAYTLGITYAFGSYDVAGSATVMVDSRRNVEWIQIHGQSLSTGRPFSARFDARASGPGHGGGGTVPPSGGRAYGEGTLRLANRAHDIDEVAVTRRSGNALELKVYSGTRVYTATGTYSTVSAARVQVEIRRFEGVFCNVNGSIYLDSRGETERIALDGSGDPGAINISFIARSAVGPPSGDRVTGTLSYRERIAMPSNCTVVIQLFDATTGRVVADQVLSNQSRTPISFSLPLRGLAIDARHRYVLIARIEKNGERLWETSGQDYVLTQGYASHVDVLLRRVDD
jgi:putative lipoprotein